MDFINTHVYREKITSTDEVMLTLKVKITIQTLMNTIRKYDS